MSGKRLRRTCLAEMVVMVVKAKRYGFHDGWLVKKWEKRHTFCKPELYEIIEQILRREDEWFKLRFRHDLPLNAYTDKGNRGER